MCVCVCVCVCVCGPGSSVGIVTDYELDPLAFCKMGTGSFPGGGGKVRLGRAAVHSPPSSATVIEE